MGLLFEICQSMQDGIDHRAKQAIIGGEYDISLTGEGAPLPLTELLNRPERISRLFNEVEKIRLLRIEE